MPESLNEQPAQNQGLTMPDTATQGANEATTLKRVPIDDEIEFISSNPVKKRLTGQQAAQPSQGSMGPPPPPPPPLQLPTTKHDTAVRSQTAPPDRCHSACGAGQTEKSGPDSAFDARGASLPALEKFAFPRPFARPADNPSRSSVDLSPKQIPEALLPLSEAGANASQSLPPAPNPAPQSSVTIDQISCLDFNGVPINSPGFDVSQIFAADGSIMSTLGICNGGNQVPAPPPPNPLATPNAIPFAMYSTGNIMTMPQAHNIGQSSASLPGRQMQSQSQQNGAPVPGNMPTSQGQIPARHHPSSGQAPGGTLAMANLSSPSAGGRTPCLHCARIRQENMLRQGHAPPLTPPTNPIQPHHSPGQPSRCPGPVSKPPMGPPAPQAQPGPTPVSTPAPTQATQHPPVPQAPPVVVAPTSFSLRSHLNTPGPSLVQDIVQTVQASFPYAQVAARHGTAPAKVVELLSSVVVAPLLRGNGRALPPPPPPAGG